MGFVDFAIDFAAVLGASRSVASKHVALRSRQLDRYTRTSSIVDAAWAVRAKQKSGAPAAATGPARTTASGGSDASAPARGPHAPRDGIQETADASSAPSSWKPHIASDASPSGLEGSADPVNGRLDRKPGSEGPREPAPAPSALRDLGSRIDKAVKSDNTVDAQSPNEIEQHGKPYEESVPEGVNLDLFRTSRGSRLSPLWKGKTPNWPETGKKQVPEGVDLGVFRTGLGSNILKELKGRPEAVDEVASKNRVSETRQSGEASTPIKAGAKDLLDPEVEHVLSAHESRRETEEVEVPGYPDPVEESNIKSAASYSETEMFGSRDDAVQLGEMLGAAETPKYELRESKVPSSRLGRIWNYGGLAASMLTGAVSEFSSRAIGGGSQGSVMFSPANMERLVAKLSTMRGAALKLGQMMSFQDEKMLPAPIQEVLQRVQDRADYMPAWQRDRVLVTNLGTEWRELYADFEEKPIAAASIGQVHRAVLKSNGIKVAVKIQYPGVADSINSDLNNLRMLLAASKLLPKGLYLNKTIDNARTELGWECDYEREAQCAQRYKDLLASEDDVFRVPQIYPEASGRQVLTMEFMDGVGVTRVHSFTQAQRDWIGTQILRLCLREITEFRFMQTDPNWTNFLYDAGRDRLVLLDFGASREYPTHFITLYVRLLAAAACSDRGAVKTLSEELGYLTGHESMAMLNAHIASVLTLAEPFLQSAPEVYDFRDQTITERVKAQIPVMIRERLAPPPEETYSLHRKLSGAFLLCARLGSRVRCREMFEHAVVKSGVLARGG